jgi:ketosteroid isomerase-like protein
MAEEATTANLVEIGRRLVEADSYEEWAVLAERFYAPDVVWDLGGMLGSIEGLPAVRAFVKEYWLMWEDHHHYAEEIVDLGHGVGYAVVREDGRMKGSDGRVQATNAWVSVWVEGRIVRTTPFTDIDEGRAAAERLAEGRAEADA